MTSSPNPSDFLSSCEIIDACHPAIVAHASSLAAGNTRETAERSFHFVRDEIYHSSDCQLNPVTCRASDVLRERTGYCYSKSHLLAALLRANQIPAGLCYQRIAMDSDATVFCLHGLNSVFLPDLGWYRIDARGNRDGIDAQFDPPTERLAFILANANEYDIPGVFRSPLPSVVQCLLTHLDWADAYAHFPDAPAAEAG